MANGERYAAAVKLGDERERVLAVCADLAEDDPKAFKLLAFLRHCGVDMQRAMADDAKGKANLPDSILAHFALASGGYDVARLAELVASFRYVEPRARAIAGLPGLPGGRRFR